MRPVRLLALTAAVAAAALLAGCGSGVEAGPGPATTGGDTFPVTIRHVYGDTVIERKPERVATVAWANHEVPLALGVVPVGMSKATWGDDDGNGVLPWVQERLSALGASAPVLFDETDGVDFEAVADTRPDVILASYSGLTKEEYDKLSRIAPTVAYPSIAWGTSVQDMVRLNSRALGRSAEGERLVADLDRRTATAFAKHPSLKGKKVVFGYLDATDLSKIGFYTTHDTRPGFMQSVGMAAPKVVVDASARTKEFSTTVSAEQADRFADADLFVLYGDPAGTLVRKVRADPLLSKIPAIRDGAIAVLADSTPLAAAANPSPLSIPWGIDDYFALLAGAADRSKG
jgi:iron complex transport system substrate-binding protein